MAPDYDRASKIIRFTTCAGCGRTIPLVLAFKAMDEHYCDEFCRNDDLMNKLREGGL